MAKGESGKGIGRRNFLKYSGMAAGAAIAGGFKTRRARADHDGGDDDDCGFGDRTLVQTIDEAQLYMTHYALFEEPDPNVPNAIYLDAATGAPTNEFDLVAPLSSRTFTRDRHHQLSAPSETSKLLPYFVSPPGFPPLPAPAPVVGAIQAVTGLPADLIAANTAVLLVAIGQFLGEGTASAKLEGRHFTVDKEMHFEVRIRTGFIFTAPSSVPAPSVGVLVGYLDFGLLHQLIGLPPPANASEIVVYSWRAPMKLSTRHRFIRQTKNEPPPVADGFPSGLREIAFIGQRVERDGSYTLVGHAKPADVEFIAPPELEQFLFGTSSLADVEFAVLESGLLAPA